MNVAVIGSGIMGSGIAQLAAMNGYRVTLVDVGEAELTRARHAIDVSLTRFVKSGRLTEADVRSTHDRLELTTDLVSAVGEATIVVEAVPEILEVKQQVLAEVVDAAPRTALLGTNTSQLSITTIGQHLGDEAKRLIGTHFFNPPVIMRLVELVRGLTTSDNTVERARSFASSLGKDVVVCQKDSPGFITTRAYAAMRVECLRILEEGVATAEDIDKAMKLAYNLPMGPLELNDFNGLDTGYHVLRSLDAAFGDRFRPTVALVNMIAAGRLGRKTSEGWFRYDADGNRISE
ncbi:MAG: 3-hydroxyacyl-CoA dehydrogenase family protein [Gaiella sp.]|nr:3-hydroxyacyl-CoA dehydrogenase family protein [Gaiella sp.]